MAGNKRQRQQSNRQARLAAQRAAQRRAKRRRRALLFGSIAAVVAAIVIVLVATQDDDDENELATSTSAPPATTAPPLPSAAGKPCLAPTDPLPPGAPAVPVKVGPPPEAIVTEDLRPGTGAPVAPGATVTVNYIGVACSTGKTFDSSYSRNQPASFPLTPNQIIPGWIRGLTGMNVGGMRLLGIPPGLGYGPQGRAPEIAPDETLWFVVEVLDAKPPGP